jgi:hypothetical protein
MTAARFPPGRIVATPGALAALEEVGERPGIFLKRLLTGDWGEVDDHDRRENELSVVQGFRLLSAYTLSNGTNSGSSQRLTAAPRCCFCRRNIDGYQNRHNFVPVFFLG